MKTKEFFDIINVFVIIILFYFIINNISLFNDYNFGAILLGVISTINGLCFWSLFNKDVNLEWFGIFGGILNKILLKK